MGCWRNFGLLVLGCVLRTTGNSIIWNYADPLTSLELNYYLTLDMSSGTRYQSFADDAIFCPLFQRQFIKGLESMDRIWISLYNYRRLNNTLQAVSKPTYFRGKTVCLQYVWKEILPNSWQEKTPASENLSTWKTANSSKLV